MFEVYPDDFNFDWDSLYADECVMGCVMISEAYESCKCPKCGRKIEIILQIRENPIGVVNYQNIDIDGGEVECSFDLSKYISFEEMEVCVRCGIRAELNDAGLCKNCDDEYSRFINSGE